MSQKDQPEAGAPGAGDQADNASGLENLEAEVMALESKPAAQVQAVQDQQAQQAASVLAELTDEVNNGLLVIRDMAGEMTDDQELIAIWSDGRIRGISASLSMVLIKHNVDMGKLAKWGPEIALAMSLALPGIATFKLIKQRQAEAMARAQPAAEGAPA